MSDHDLVIVGSGPAGLSAASHAQESGLDYVVLERAPHIADTVHAYQARKYVMAEPMILPSRGDLPFEAGSRESILSAWSRHCQERSLRIEYGQEVVGVERGSNDVFTVRTKAGEKWRAPKVILAVGTQGSIRKPNVEGEDLPHVHYRLGDPSEYEDQDILVVGAGDSALEIALSLADENRVSLIVRSSEIVRAKESLTRDALGREASGLMTIYYDTTLHRIESEVVDLDVRGEIVRVPADHLFVKIGADPPRKFFESIGVEYGGPGRDAQPVLTQSYETTVEGLYLIGAASGRDLIKLGMNQGWEVVETILGHDVEPADEQVLREKLPHLEGTVHERIGTLQEKIPLIGAASSEQIREMLLATRFREFGINDEIIRQNDYTNEFMVIAGGRVEVRVRNEEGIESRVAELTAGNFFGEMSLISGRRRSATVVAKEPTRIIEIPRKAMLKLIRIAPGVRDLVDRAFLIRAVQGYLFPSVSTAQLGDLVGRAELLNLSKDHVVFNEGDPGDAFYFIRKGMVKIARTSGDREVVLSYLVAGNFFGETALLSDSARTATVSTIFPSDLIRLSKEDFHAFLRANPELREGPMKKLEERRIDALIADATPGAGDILSDLIREEVVMGTDTLVIDEHLCVRCSNCVSACEGVHDDGQSRLSLTGIRLYNILAPNSCWQCENPLCMLDCPPDAIARDPRGEVYIKSNCIGCGNCEANCPYDNVFMVHPKPKTNPFSWLVSLFRREEETKGEEDTDRTVAVKCDLCRDIAGGPACVRSCPTGAALRLTPEEYRDTLEEIVITRGER
ncbi:MAG: cyclic nucleotide-binding domain-containing protein [Thermoanaerobaculia bacterium]|nr:cyclic nucleotide-binding domain-containing protein [Thermoanaerobaculia bacterium]